MGKKNRRHTASLMDLYKAQGERKRDWSDTRKRVTEKDTEKRTLNRKQGSREKKEDQGTKTELKKKTRGEKEKPEQRRHQARIAHCTDEQLPITKPQLELRLHSNAEGSI